MSTEQHDADAYGQELARISNHQHEATDARFTVFQALAAAGIGHEQADDIVAKLAAGAVAGAHTWISESSPRTSPSRGSRTAGSPGSATSPATYCASPTPPPPPGAGAPPQRHAAHPRPAAALPRPGADDGGRTRPASVPPLEAKDVLAAAERFLWAVAAPGTRHWPDGSDFLDIALSAVGDDEEREGYIERLEAFVEQQRARLEELLRAYGPGSRPALHGRYALVGLPETLVDLERMEAVPFLLRGR
ncbi:hypothetical protein ACF1DV_36825 [Streptomyces achromogenes]|uniref:hypothetical protein n=1 Tax=Streptomyces achromogenes TaxID=67255 RepID=UPI0036F7BA02